MEPQTTTTTTTTGVGQTQPETRQQEGGQYLTEGEHRVKGKFLPAQRVCCEKPIFEKSELPTAIKEKILPSERIEIQPVLKREREQLEIHHIQQPITEHLIHRVEVKEEVLPTKDIGEFKEEGVGYTHQPEKSEVEVAPFERETIRLPPIVEERVRKKIVEEIQPVIYRQTEQPHVIRKTQPVIERVVDAPVVTREVLPTKDWGSHYVETKLASELRGTTVSERGTGQHWPSETYQYKPSEGLQYAEGGGFTQGQYRPSETYQYKPTESFGGQYRTAERVGGQYREVGKSTPFQEGGGQFTGSYTGSQTTGGYTGSMLMGEEIRRPTTLSGGTVPSEKMQV